MSNPITSVLIVGGGNAGWITAGIIAAAHKSESETALQVTLVESPNVPTIGVGEGTWPTLRDTLRKMGVSEAEFIRECDVSFKQGARFDNWVTGQTTDKYYHPLVLPQGYLDGNLVPAWQRELSAEISFAHAVSPQATICDQGLAPKQVQTPEYAAVQNYAYHLDAGKLVQFLQRFCVDTLGVKHVLADITGVNAGENGDIKSVQSSQAGEIYGDLFVDCTGFKSLLLGQHYKVPFKSCADKLFIDKALAVHLPYQDESDPIASQTISSGQSAGWIWDIGLYSRRGVGHVYSSGHVSEEMALNELANYVEISGHDLSKLNVKKIDIHSGHRETFWQNNCVAIGLSAGFLEPLEASALVLIELSANMIAAQMPVNRDAMEVVSKRFNKKFLYRWNRIIDFLKLHYMLTQRDDSAFWSDNRQPDTIPDSLKELLELWKYQSPFHDDFDHKDEVFPSASWQYVLYGMGFKTKPNPRGISEGQGRFSDKQFDQVKIMTQKMIAGLPTNRELLTQMRI